jgi:NitT/TauT family transport system substrate-binding protein
MMSRQLPGSGLLHLLALAVVLGTACTPAAAPAPAAGTAKPAVSPQAQAEPARASTAEPASPVTAPTISYGWQLTAFAWPSFIALKKGFFQQAGVEVDVVLIGGGGTAATQLLVSGGAHVVSGGPETVILASERGDDTIFIGTEGLKAPHRIVARTGITRPEELRGKTISVPDLVQGATLVLHKHLAAHGLAKEDYDLVPSGGSQNRYAALTSGAVDATILAQPLDFQALDQGFVGLGLTSDVLSEWLFTVYSVRRSWAAANPEAATGFIKGLQLAGAWLYDPQNKEEAIAILREYTKTDDAAARRTYDLYVTELGVLSRDGEIKEQHLRPLFDAMVEHNLLPRGSGPLTKYYDNAYVERARRQR